MISDTIEDIILRHSARGMNELSKYMPAGFCKESARDILSWRAGGTIIIVTGFYVAGHAETDGPPGTIALAHALDSLGFNVMVATDTQWRGLFEGEGLHVRYFEPDADRSEFDALLDELQPVGLISVERCGRTRDGRHLNMHGISIDAHNAPIDLLFDAAAGRIPTIGVGDGGNEIGMGCVADEIHRISGIEPCAVCVDHLVIATVSNWGAYGLCAYLGQMRGKALVPVFDEISDMLARMIRFGCVDGVSKLPTLSVDGFNMDTEREILDALAEAARL